MSEELVKRLRQWDCGESTWELLESAADRIEQDAQHIDEMYELVAEMNADHTTSKTRIEKLEAALRAIIVHCEVPAPPNVEALKMFARKALEGENE
jgi:hypothetical protein